MKLLLAAPALLLSLNSFSDETLPLLLSVEYPPNPVMNVRQLRKIEVEGNGKVVETLITYPKGQSPSVSSRSFPQLTGALFEKVRKCTAELGQSEFRLKSLSFCTDDGGTHYKVLQGETFAGKFCGQLQTVPGECANDMVKLLDKLSNI